MKKCQVSDYVVRKTFVHLHVANHKFPP